VVRTAEAAGFVLATIADSPLPPSADGNVAGRIEAGTRAAYLSTITDRIGLAPELHVAVTEPFHVATQLASLDHASKGRGAWVVGAAGSPAAMATVGAVALRPDALRQEAIDAVDVVRALWDSWEDDAIIRDAATGRFLDKDKVHHVDFTGSRYSVKGPLIATRPPQGQLVVLADAALRLGERADIALVTDPTARTDSPLTFLELEVVLDAEAPAAERLAALDEASPWTPTGRLRHVGSVGALVDLLSALVGRDGQVDGVRLHPAVLAVDLPVLAEQVLPALTSAGLHRAPRPGDTLRASLGLARPTNRFAPV
jgi:alkanesulfonate monooxygenase SsuD/methylene tetrahydromethanopterin reductase-like flavin-dependent oxidoreductase (luciferase family)